MSAIIETMRQRLAALAPEHLDIEDDSASHAGHAGARSGGHYNVLIVSACFSGKSRIERQRMVYDALGDLMQHGIHALALKTLTPDDL